MLCLEINHRLPYNLSLPYCLIGLKEASLSTHSSGRQAPHLAVLPYPHLSVPDTIAAR